MSNSFGNIFKITTFGESHGEAIGVIIDGCPSGVRIDISKIQFELDRRRPGQSNIVTQRKESDTVEILSGIFESISTGSPISLLIRNENQKSKDYNHIKDKYRPSHADFTYEKKYGFRDYRGGGRSSARETAARVAAGSIAKQLIEQISEVEIYSYVSSVGEISLDKRYKDLDLSLIDSNEIRCPDEETASKMILKIKEVKKDGDTIGGTIQGVLKNVPIGLGEPVFEKFHAQLGNAMLGINAVKGFEFGSGFKGALMLGSQHNDLFMKGGGTKTNHSGGVQGGITNGEDVYFRIAFKPVATIMKDQHSINSNDEEVIVEGKGRHDACVLPRAVPIVDAMSALVIADFLLLNKLSNVDSL